MTIEDIDEEDDDDDTDAEVTTVNFCIITGVGFMHQLPKPLIIRNF